MEQPVETMKELLEMRARLRVLAGRFNEETSACECCGLTKYEARDEYNAAQQIDGAITRVEKALTVVEKHTEHFVIDYVVQVTWCDDSVTYDAGDGRLSPRERDAIRFGRRDAAEGKAAAWISNDAVLDASAVLLEVHR